MVLYLGSGSVFSTSRWSSVAEWKRRTQVSTSEEERTPTAIGLNCVLEPTQVLNTVLGGVPGIEAGKVPHVGSPALAGEEAEQVKLRSLSQRLVQGNAL